MADVKKIATREGYGQALVELGKLHEDVVVLDADLAGATKTGAFKKVFPDQYICVDYRIHREHGIVYQSDYRKERDKRYYRYGKCF